MRAAREPLSALVAEVDLPTLVEHYAGQGRPQGASTVYRCPNPEHHDRHPSFTVARGRNGKWRAHCWSACGWHGDALALVQWREGLSVADAARWLRRWLGRPEEYVRPRAELRAVRAPQQPAPAPRVRALTDSTPRVDADWADAVMARYLEGRGWPATVVDRFGLEVVRDRFGTVRVRHPFYAPAPTGEWVVAWWQDRAGGNTRPKWDSPRGGRPLLHNLRSIEADNVTAVVLCEGPADCITASEALTDHPHVAVLGIPGANNWRAEWAQLLTGLRVVVAADDDEAGRNLEQAVATSVPGPVRCYRPSRGDVTDTARALGMAAVRVALLEAIGPEPAPPEVTALELLLALFPGAEVLDADSAPWEPTVRVVNA